MSASANSPLESQAPEVAEAYTWTFPGAPVRIDLRFEAVSKLLDEMKRAEPSEPGATLLEVGGLLLGRPGTPPTTVEIFDCIALPGLPEPEGKYVLNVTTLKRMREEVSGADRVTRLNVIGYFRTDTQGKLNLRDEELEMVRQEFSNPREVVLLAQASGEMPNAGFLFWDGGTFMPFSFMDFPLDVAELRRAAARKAAPPPEPKVEARPDTPRQEPEQRSRRRGRWVPISIVILLLLLAVPAYLFRDRWVPALPSFTRAPAAAPSALQLQVEAKGAGLNVRWDRQSPAIVRAREGRLWITESGGPPDIVELSIEDLKNGQVYYQSSADRLQFRLEVLDETGRLTRESVLALSSRRAAAPAAPGTPETTPPERQVRSVPVPEDLGSPALTPPAPPVRASRPFTPPSSGGASRPSDQQLVQDSPPAVVADSETAGGAGPPVPTGSASLPRAPSPSPAEPAGTQAVPAQPQPAPSAPQTFVPATYRPPVPKTQVRPPVTPSVRALLRKDVEISVQIEIDKTGKPVNALALSHDATLGGYLERASLAAAMQWRFEPARLGGQPVASAHKVMFVFRKP